MSTLPAVYYHYPSLYTVDFPMDAFLDLASRSSSEYFIPTLAGVKYIDGNMKTLTNATGVAGGKFILFNNDPLLAGMAAGASGAISYTTLFPTVAAMHKAWASGDMDTARAAQRRLLEADALIGKYGGKSAARMLPALMAGMPNIDLGPPRPPLVGLDSDQVEEFRQALKAHGFLRDGSEL